MRSRREAATTAWMRRFSRSSARTSYHGSTAVNRSLTALAKRVTLSLPGRKGIVTLTVVTR